MNKRRLRTEAVIQAAARRRIAKRAGNAIEQARLVRSRVIVEDKQYQELMMLTEGEIDFGLGYCPSILPKKSLLSAQAGWQGGAAFVGGDKILTPILNILFLGASS